MFGSGSTPIFSDLVRGTWGSFNTPAGRVDYIMTKARLGGNPNLPERKLTKSLAPVREIMEADSLDFNQLLQRDLDDHRVAVKLIPYLLKPQLAGPAFFPPIMAVLLPFRDKRPTTFPELTGASVVSEDGAQWQEQSAGNAFKIQRVLNARGELDQANYGKLWWNPTEAGLVVLDGQHRAMALLAIERTKSRSWNDTAGAKYKSFYEHQVQQLLEDHDTVDLEGVEVPVTVCWFPEQTGPQARPHEAARKLFVDVNKEARPPSESRIILLSDSELTNVLTRSLLSALRSPEEKDLLPLYAVEYDNPDARSSRPARWSVLTNVQLLKLAVNYCIFGPREYLDRFGGTLQKGTISEGRRDEFMRDQLGMTTLFPTPVEDGGRIYSSEKIGDRNFPLGQVGLITDRFSRTWGRAFLTLLSKTAPYAAHTRALRKLNEEWDATDSRSGLAKDAIFGGVGVYWTLRDSHDHYEEIKTRNPSAPKSDVVRAWTVLQEKKERFEEHRAYEYLGSKSEKNQERSDKAFQVLNTQACQLGQAMAMGSLWQLRKSGNADLNDLPKFAEALVDAWNAFFSVGHGTARDRRLAFNRNGITHPINQIDKMDSGRAFYFRYFWLEALCTPEAWPHIADWIPDHDLFQQRLSEARSLVLKLYTSQNQNIIARSNPRLPENKRAVQAAEDANASLRRALKEWFAKTEGELDKLFSHRTPLPGDES